MCKLWAFGYSSLGIYAIAPTTMDQSQPSNQNSPNDLTVSDEAAVAAGIDSAYTLASRLLVQDWRWLIAYSLANALPYILSGTTTVGITLGSLSVWELGLSVTAVVIQLVCFAHLCGRIIPLKTTTGSIPHLPKPYLLIGLFLGIWLTVGKLAALTLLSEKAILLAALICFPTVWLYLRLFFFFGPSLAGLDWRSSVKIAHNYTENSKLLALHALVGPQLLCALLSAILGIISPDKSNQLIYWLDSFVLGLQEPLIGYLALALSLSILPEGLWGKLPDKYLETIAEMRTPTTMSTATRSKVPMIARLLSLRHALKFAILVLLVQSANLSRYLSIPPSVSVDVMQARANGSDALLVLTLKDPKEKFRGFLPSQLTLRGETGASIVDGEKPIPEFILNGKSIAANHIDTELAKLNTNEVQLKLRFFTNRRPEHLGQLKDLHIWYFMTKLAPIKFENTNAIVTRTTNDAPSPVVAARVTPPSRELLGNTQQD